MSKELAIVLIIGMVYFMAMQVVDRIPKCKHKELGLDKRLIILETEMAVLLKEREEKK